MKKNKPIFSAYPSRELKAGFQKYCKEKGRAESEAILWLVRQELKERRMPKNSISD